jgi:hypothetical protein
VKIQEEILVLEVCLENELQHQRQLEHLQREQRNEGQSILDAINRRMDQFESTQRELLEAIGSVEKEFNASEYDIWTERGRSVAEQADFKRRLVKYYNCKNWWPFGTKLRCMVTNEWLSPDVVIASHIWKSSTRGKGLLTFGLTINDLTDPRNGLLVLKDIQNAFDMKQLCFLYQPFGTVPTFRVKVLDVSIKDRPIKGSSKIFADIDGAVLQTPLKNFLTEGFCLFTLVVRTSMQEIRAGLVLLTRL